MRLWRSWRERRDEELQEEIESHLEMAVRDRMADGEPEDLARIAARREFGNVELVRAVTRDSWGWTWVDGWMQDLSHAIRALHRYRGLTIAAVLTLGLGIGVNIAVFSVVNALLIQPFPGVDPERLIHVQAVSAEGRVQDFTSYPNYEDLASASVFTGLMASNVRAVGLQSSEGMEQHLVEVVTGNYFSVLGSTAEAGRLLTDRDDRPDAPPAVVVSESFWRARFTPHAAALGQSIILNGESFTIVGVAPSGFSGTFAGAAIDFWVPLQKASSWIGEDLLINRDAPGLRVMGRLDRGADLALAQSAVATIANRLAANYPDTNRGEEFRVTPARRLSGGRRARVSRVLAIAMGFVVLVLVAAGTNFLNLLLTRAVSRRRETSLKVAIGASSSRLMRQHFAEGLVLAFTAGSAGLVFGIWATHLLSRFNPVPSVEVRFDFTPDARVLLFTIALTVLVGLCLGLVPALHAMRRDVVSTLRDESAGARGGRQGSNVRSALVVAQVALSTVLLIGATLFARSLERLQRTELGFSPEDVIALDIDTTAAGLTGSRERGYYRELVTSVAALPGAESASMANDLPPTGRTLSVGVQVDGHEPRPGQSSLKVSFNRIDSGYFDTLRIPLVAGRDFTEMDDDEHSGVVIVNQTMAERFWPAGDALGKEFRLASEAENRELAGRNMSDDTLRVVGVAGDVRHRGYDANPEPHIYVPYRQRPSGFPRTLIIRGASLSAGAVQNEIRSLNRDVHVFFPRTLEEHAALSLVPTRLAATLSSVLGTVAALLATIGLYGVLSFWVVRRSPEIGIQIALGAGRKDIWLVVLARWSRLVGAGLCLGIVAALALGRFISASLHGIGPRDPGAILSATIVLAAVALVACIVPARRAARLDAVRVLRGD